MADSYTQLNPGVGGDVMDETAVTYGSSPINRKRARVVVTGNNSATEIVGVSNSSPAGDAIGLVVRPVSRSGSSSINRVSASGSNVTLLSANTSRTMATVFNEGTSSIYIKLGTTASFTSYTIKLYPSGYYEIPAGYTGRIDAIWDVVSGAAQVTELS